MTKKQLVIVVLAAGILAYRSLDFWEVVHARASVAELGASVEFDGGRLRVSRVQPVRLDGRATAAWTAGLRRGDGLAAFDDGAGARAPVDSLAALGRALHRMDASPRAALIFERQGPAGRAEIRLVKSGGGIGGWPFVALRAFPLVVLPVLAVVTALFIVSVKPDDGQAFLAGLLFLSFSALFGAEFWRFPPVFREAAGTVHECLLTFFGYLLLRFFLTFPGPSALDRAAPWLKQVLIVPVAALAAFSSALNIAATYSLRAGNALYTAIGGSSALWMYVACVVGPMVLGLLTGLWELVHAPTPSDRRRLSVLLGGALAGLLPMLAAVAYFSLRGADAVTPWAAMLVLPTLPLFPLSFIYAVVRHRVLGVRVIVRKGLQYALVSRGFLVAEGLVVFLALYFGVGPELTRAFPAAGGGALATTNAVAALFVVAGIAGVNRRLKPTLDRRFFRDRYAVQAVLSDLGGDLVRTPTDAWLIARALAMRLATSLHARTAAVFLDERLVRAPGGDDPGRAGAPRYVPAASVGAAGEDVATTDIPVGPLARAGRAAGEGNAWLQRSTAVPIEPGNAGLDPLWERGVRLVVPLAGRDAQFGWLVLGDKLSEEAYTLEDRAFVEAAAQQAVTALDYARLIGRVAEQEAMRRELDIAREVQAGLFPQKRPPVSTLDYCGTCRTAREVGGDYFDFLEIDPSHLGLAVADISGKGVSAALLMSNLQAMFRSRAALEGVAVGRLVAGVNRLLADSTDPSKFATLFYGVFDSRSRRLAYVNAGHNPPFLVRGKSGDVSRLAPTGMALGFQADACYEVVEESLEPGDLLVVFTDGVTEALDEEGNEYGEDRLAALLLERRGMEAQALSDDLLADVFRHVGAARQHDDVTVVVARVR